jgi:hypothetical protein
LDSITRLDARRKAVAVAVLLVFALTFTPIPLVYIFPEEGTGVVQRALPVLAGALAGLIVGLRLCLARLIKPR